MGNTPLHLACNHNQLEVARLLTEERCCDQNIRNLRGELAVHIACAKGSYELVKLAIRYIQVIVITFALFSVARPDSSNGLEHLVY